MLRLRSVPTSARKGTPLIMIVIFSSNRIITGNRAYVATTTPRQHSWQTAIVPINDNGAAANRRNEEK
jgi:hypothetical protein